jgi:surface antigen
MKNRSLNNRKKLRSWQIVFCLITVLIVVLLIDSTKIGKEIDQYRDVSVYYNGIVYTRSHGRYYSDSGYYYGQKWQCVEYIKRFYAQAKQHSMPDVFGNAKDYFDSSVGQGQLNESRGLIQYRNGESISPKPDDLIVFTDRRYGHVAIITTVTDDSIEIIQQNILWGTRNKLPLRMENGNYYVGNTRKPAGWLRLE